MLRNLNQEKFKAASSIIDHLEVTPQDLGLEKSVANDEALRLLFSRYYERLAAEHTRVQIQVNTILRLDGTTCVSKSKYLDPGGQGVQGDQENLGQGVPGGQANAQDQAVAGMARKACPRLRVSTKGIWYTKSHNPRQAFLVILVQLTVNRDSVNVAEKYLRINTTGQEHREVNLDWSQKYNRFSFCTTPTEIG